MPKKDPCQRQACEIQKCLQANKYIESRCADVIEEMRKCCVIHTSEESVCCSGFAREQAAAEKKT
ncbi:cx9C motif-containing protein 4 [Engraulis encrasicolus]|uniref:cx9C motif-containing protein 4 n=1 Tax=Engraulis encrasicolus TaxID=184585 RepID=UPI002FD52C5E